jgi:hypothetical protein
MGSKGCRLWVMCQLDSNLQSPAVAQHPFLGHPPGVHGAFAGDGERVRGVALQVAFERQTLKPVFHLIGYRLWV